MTHETHEWFHSATRTGATLDGIKVALAALALGVFLAACVYVSNRCGLGGEGR